MFFAEVNNIFTYFANTVRHAVRLVDMILILRIRSRLWERHRERQRVQKPFWRIIARSAPDGWDAAAASGRRRGGSVPLLRYERKVAGEFPAEGVSGVTASDLRTIMLQMYTPLWGGARALRPRVFARRGKGNAAPSGGERRGQPPGLPGRGIRGGAALAPGCGGTHSMKGAHGLGGALRALRPARTMAFGRQGPRIGREPRSHHTGAGAASARILQPGRPGVGRVRRKKIRICLQVMEETVRMMYGCLRKGVVRCEAIAWGRRNGEGNAAAWEPEKKTPVHSRCPIRQARKTSCFGTD
ncbi:MAG: hypothetical protein JWP03_1435 [Phycisphaerales bacterium]|nr:hypothetical protein [Phycisphaerales bacterium]